MYNSWLCLSVGSISTDTEGQVYLKLDGDRLMINTLNFKVDTKNNSYKFAISHWSRKKWGIKNNPRKEEKRTLNKERTTAQ